MGIYDGELKVSKLPSALQNKPEYQSFLITQQSVAVAAKPVVRVVTTSAPTPIRAPVVSPTNSDVKIQGLLF
mgnify:CR=1 FL=1